MANLFDALNLEIGSLTSEHLEDIHTRAGTLAPVHHYPRQPDRRERPDRVPWYGHIPWADWIFGPDPRNIPVVQINRARVLERIGRGRFIATISTGLGHVSSVTFDRTSNHRAVLDHQVSHGSASSDYNPNGVVHSNAPNTNANVLQSNGISHNNNNEGEYDDSVRYDITYTVTFWAIRLALGIITAGCSSLS